MEIKKVGVVGCGQMGSGIVTVCALSGFPVVVSEVNEQLLNKGLTSIDQNLGKSVEKGKMSAADKNAVMKRITGTTDTRNFNGCDLVVEAAIENLDIKKKIFADLDKVCGPQTVLASNTSSMSIIDIAAVTKRPDKVIGMHFFNPPQVMKLLEIVRSVAVSPEVVDACKKFGETLGKTVVMVKDSPAFVVNALLVPFLLNAIRMYDAGIASRDDIDNAVKGGLNHPMGPLTLADYIGLDTVLFLSDAVYSEIKDPQWAAPILLRKMVAAGWYGRKSGKGFYDYK